MTYSFSVSSECNYYGCISFIIKSRTNNKNSMQNQVLQRWIFHLERNNYSQRGHRWKETQTTILTITSHSHISLCFKTYFSMIFILYKMNITCIILITLRKIQGRASLIQYVASILHTRQLSLQTLVIGINPPKLGHKYNCCQCQEQL